MSDPGIGHNGVNKSQLTTIVERIERLEEEKQSLADDIKEVYAEAKGNGFDTKTIRKVVALRRKSAVERAEEEAMLEIYMEALGMLRDTPLGEAAVERAARDPEIKKAVKKMGKPVPVTEEEKKKGVKAAWVRPDGTRVSLAPGVRK